MHTCDVELSYTHWGNEAHTAGLDCRSHDSTHELVWALHMQSWSEHALSVLYRSGQIALHCVVNGLQSQKLYEVHSV